MQKALRGTLAGYAAAACLSVVAAGPAAAQQTQRYEAKAAARLAELQIDDSQMQSIRYVVRRKVDDRAGPDIEGVEAYVRLKQCSGYLVIQMNRAAYVRQTYTTGDCRVAGVDSY
ncbi:MAG: hypothetical protein ACM35H_05890 [Bacteroidota bacterium]|nr:hypothetical protein [Kiloniellaceae bacterium]